MFSFRVESAGCPANPPTDPDVKISLIRFLGYQYIDTILTHNLATLQASDTVNNFGQWQRISFQKKLILLPDNFSGMASSA